MSMRAEYAAVRRRHAGGRLLKTVFLSPVRALWWFATRVEGATGIVFTLVLGAFLIVGGLFLNTTVIGFVLGVPMLIVGVFLTLRALY